jgi:hypothetical protein
MAGSAGTAGPTGPTGPSGPSCVDFVINSQADLQTIAPHVSNEHILSGNGTYCFGSFAMTAGRKIVIASGAKVELKGHGTTSLLQGDIDGPILLLRSGSVVHLHDMKLQNTRTTGTPRSLESDTTEAYIHDIAIMCEFGEGVRVTSTQPSGSRFFATQLRISNCQTGISCRGGEVFLNNYDCEALTRGVSIDGSHGGLQWIGGRCGSYTYALRINAACYSILLHGVTATSGSEFVRYESGSIDRVNIMGNTVSVTTTAARNPHRHLSHGQKDLRASRDVRSHSGGRRPSRPQLPAHRVVAQPFGARHAGLLGSACALLALRSARQRRLA